MFIQREVDHREECLFKSKASSKMKKYLDYKEDFLLRRTRVSVKQELCDYVYIQRTS